MFFKTKELWEAYDEQLEPREAVHEDEPTIFPSYVYTMYDDGQWPPKYVHLTVPEKSKAGAT